MKKTADASGDENAFSGNNFFCYVQIPTGPDT